MSYNDGLYKWERITKPRVYSRSQRVKSDNDIEDWIKKVEDASSKAAAETFGTKYVAPKRVAKEKVKTTIQNAQIHEAAYAEAHDLLNEWVTQKIHLGDDLEDYTDDNLCIKTQADVRKEWDHLTSSEADLELEDLETQRSSAERKARIDKDPYSILYKDDGDLVNEVLDTMWDKDIYGDNFKQNLELEPEKLYDPTTKMKLRHQQVKENRDKRLKVKEKKLKELQMKKDSQFKARQMIMKEEKHKAMHKKREEDEIQRNMAQIRKELENERRNQKEEQARQKEETDALAIQAIAELDRQRDIERQVKRKTHQQTEERRQHILARMKMIETRQAREKLQMMQKHFSAWYSVVMERRLSQGKAKATADWKLLLRSFNAWKAYTRSKHLDRQAWNHEESLKQLHRKTNMADLYYRHRLMSKCLVAWQLFVSQQLSHRVIEEDSHATKNKMAAFLKAAASGKLWTERSKDGETPHQTPKDRNPEELDALFKQSSKPKGTFSLNSTARSEVGGSKPPKKVDTPHEPWQITKKHLQLTKKQIAKMGQVTSDSNRCTCHKNKTTTQSDYQTDTENHHLCSTCSQARTTVDSKDSKVKKSWAKAPFSVNNFVHRHAAQQKILEMQQKQIKEQQELIVELQYLQKQQMLQQQLLQQENMKKQLGGGGQGGHSTESIQNTLTHLQEHIQRLQQQLMSGTSPLQHCSPEDVAGTSPHNTQNSPHSTVQDIELKDIEDEAGSTTTTSTVSKANTGSLRLYLSSVDNADVTSKAKSSHTERNKMLNNTAQSSTATTTGTKVLSSSRPGATPTTSRKPAEHPRHTEFVKQMEDRAGERARIKQEREDKKRREEEERMVKLIAQEEEMRRAEEQEKKQRLEAHRMKKRLEKQRDLEKQQFAKRMKALTLEADSHYEKAVLKFRGWLPWRQLIRQLRDKERLAHQHYHRSLQRTCLLSWHKTVTKEITEKNSIADQFHMYLTTKQAFSHWCQIKEASAIQEQKAIRHFESKLKVKVIRIWADYAAEEKVSMWHKERFAKEHNIERIKKKYFRMLKEFPILRKEEELREHRRHEMRRKVANLLPDFRASQTD